MTASILGPAALAAIWLGGSVFAAIVVLMTIGLSHEWLTLCGERRSMPALLLFAALPVAVVAAACGYFDTALGLLALATVAGAVLKRGIGRDRPLAFGLPYLGCGAVALIWLRAPAGSGGANVIVLLLVIWATDIGAYVVGRTVGGPRLWPAVSPGKTWSGAIGGLLAAAAVAWGAAASLGGGTYAWRPIVFAITASIIGQAGDLFESRLKRHFGVKDSGTLVPGHGGLLDRLDSVLTAAPAAALLALALGRGVVLWE